VIAPLSIGRRTVGALKVYRIDGTPPYRETIEGMASILSLHLELAELDRERQLAADAKLDALRAQINPHFLYNTLNTIASKARTDPEQARQLLLRLSEFFRYSTRQEGQFADFGQEYFFVRTYVSLEQARYGDRLRVHYAVDPQVLAVQVPVLVIQPLVENAIKHGLAAKVGGGTVTLRARVDPLARITRVLVRDDGVGMDERTLQQVLAGRHEEGGVGLRNISERLSTLFGERYALAVRSGPEEGTTVDLRMPLR
jgi:two-component system LytT family sensor kinase